MGLNVSFKGYIYDEDDNKIDCKYQVHYVRQNVWNDIRDTDSQYFSCNAGDDDSLTQDGELKSGDVILLTFWQGDGDGGDTPNTRDAIFDRFAVMAITHDGSTSEYSFDIKLKPKAKPNCSFYLSSARTINRELHATDISNDDSGWSYDDHYFKHTHSYYGVTVFPRVNRIVREYNWDVDNDDSPWITEKADIPNLEGDNPLIVDVDETVTVDDMTQYTSVTIKGDADDNTGTVKWDDGDGEKEYHWNDLIVPKVAVIKNTDEFNSVTVLDDAELYVVDENGDYHTYTDIGDYTVGMRLTNAWDLTCEVDKDIKIKYNSPIGKVTFDPDGVSTKVHTTESSTATADITDEDDRITEIEHHWIVINRDDSDDVISDDTIDTNTELDYSYDETIEVLQKHYAKQIIKWNDGYDDLTLEYVKELPITNWKPLVDFTFKYLNDMKLEFTPNCSDIDGDVVNYRWDLYSLIPFKDGEYAQALMMSSDDPDKQTIEFKSLGHYKMVLTARDDYGDSVSLSKEFDITGSTACVGTAVEDEICFIIPSKYDY